MDTNFTVEHDEASDNVIVDALLSGLEEKKSAARELGDAHQLLLDAQENYEREYKRCLRLGFSEQDLVKAGCQPLQNKKVKRVRKSVTR